MAEVDNFSQSHADIHPDILHIVSTELAAQLDFATLFNCAASSKHFAVAGGALAQLYRISHLAPVKGGGNEALSFSEQCIVVQRWSIMWKSIMLSCFDDQTMFPYVHFLRVLDLRDLYELLDDDKFRNKVYDNFFTGVLQQFDFMNFIGTRQQKFRTRGAKLRTQVAAMGDVVVKNAAMLEEVTEPSIGEYSILANSLQQWAPDLSRLQSLELWDGKTLGNETLRNLLHANCPSLQRICIYQWREDESDHLLAEFISNMPWNSLVEFENLAECNIGPETCLAFNIHGSSLKSLKLALPEKGISGLGLLKSCTKIERLKITDLNPPHDLKATQNDVFLDVVSWLKDCKNLREVSLTDFPSAPDILAEVLMAGESRLEELEIGGREDSLYMLKEHDDFHTALGTQISLRHLLLKCDSEPFVPERRDNLVDQLCRLKNLRYLKLTRTSDFFQDNHIKTLASSLTMLEDLLIAGWQLGDACLEPLSKLTNLKSIIFNGPSNFTSSGLLDLIANLGAGNQGLALSVDMAITDTRLSDEEQDVVREALIAKVQGRFEYQLIRDPDVPEFYDDEDSD